MAVSALPVSVPVIPLSTNRLLIEEEAFITIPIVLVVVKAVGVKVRVVQSSSTPLAAVSSVPHFKFPLASVSMVSQLVSPLIEKAVVVASVKSVLGAFKISLINISPPLVLIVKYPLLSTYNSL